MKKIVVFSSIGLAFLAFALVAFLTVQADAKPRFFSGDKVAWLGVYTQTVDEQIAETYNLKTDRGAIINEVVDDSPASKAGLLEDDVIIRFGGDRVRDADDLTELVWDHVPGDEVEVLVVRDGQEKEYKITLDSRQAGWAPRADGPGQYYAYQPGKRGYLGVTLDDLSEQLGEFFGVERGRGALVKEVVDDSPASKAGLKAGDVIVAINEDRVREADDVSDAIRDLNDGDEAKIKLLRDPKEQTVTAKIEERESIWGSRNIIRIPDVPRIDVDVPRMHDMHFGRQGAEYYLDDDDLEEIDDEIREAMKEARDELREELAEMENDLREVKRDTRRGDLDVDRDALQRELKELREELKAMKAELQKLRDERKR